MVCLFCLFVFEWGGGSLEVGEVRGCQKETSGQGLETIPHRLGCCEGVFSPQQ